MSLDHVHRHGPSGRAHGTTWCALPGGGTETVTYYTDQRSRSSVDDVRKGTVMGTAVVPTQIHIKTESSTSYESHNTTDSPTSWYEWHTKSWSNVETLRELSLAASYIKGSSYSASAWKMIDKVSGATSSNVTDPPITSWQMPWGGPDPAPWWYGAGAIGTAVLSGYYDVLAIFGNPIRAWETGNPLYLIPGVSSSVSAIDSFQGYLSVGADPFMAGALTVASNLPLANSALSIIEMYNGISLRGTDFGRQLTTFDYVLRSVMVAADVFGAVRGLQAARLAALQAARGISMGPNVGLLPTVDLVRQYAANVRRVAGFTDVFIHGALGGNSFMVLHNGNWLAFNARQLATFLGRQGVTGNIRLVSCYSGAGRIAQDLANKLGVIVRAPTNLIYVYPNGQLMAPLGTIWRDFIPGVIP